MDGTPIQALIGDIELIKQLKEEINPWLLISLKIWSEMVTKNSLRAHTKMLRWIAYDSEFIPNREDKRFKRWENGPKIFWELMKKQEIKSFQELKNQYGLGYQDLFR